MWQAGTELCQAQLPAKNRMALNFYLRDRNIEMVWYAIVTKSTEQYQKQPNSNQKNPTVLNSTQ